MLSRRDALLGAGSLALASCAPKPPGQAAKSISVLYFADLAEGKRMRAQADAFEKTTGTKIVWKEAKYDDIRPSELPSLTAPRGAYDILYVDDVWMYEYVKKGLLKDLTPYIQRDKFDYDDFIPKVVDAEGKLNGHAWLIPHRADVQVLFFNKAIFGDAAVRAAFRARTGRDLAVPATWVDYRATARGLHGLDFGGRKLIGSAETFKRPHFAFEFFATRYWSLTGQDFLDAAGKPIFASPAGVAALEYLGSLKDSWAPGSLNAAHDETISALSGGNVALCPQWYGFYSKLHDPKALGDRLGVAPMPGAAVGGGVRRAPSIGGGSVGIAANSAAPDAAWEFLKFSTSRPVMAAGAEAGEIVTRRSAYASPSVAQKNPAAPIYLQSLDTSKFRPRSANYAAMETAIGEGVSRYLAGEVGAAAALGEAARSVTEINAQSA